MKKLIFALALFATTAWSSPLIPPPLKPGDTVALISSGFRIDNNALFQQAKRRLESLGLHVVVGKAVLGHAGYFAGPDEARAADLNWAFQDPEIAGIFEIRGGFGSARLLNKLDYATIAAHPKILVGFSDITALLMAIHTKTGLVTYHGPMPGSFEWPNYTVQELKAALFSRNAFTLSNPPGNPITVITPGRASGILMGGNLTVLASLLGTPYVPSNWKGKILFLEDTHEDAYQIDRALTQLELAGVLSQISGFVFGSCTACTTQIPGSPSVLSVIQSHIAPLHIPAWYGAMIGHQSTIWTVPEGIPVTIDAQAGTIQIQ